MTTFGLPIIAICISALSLLVSFLSLFFNYYSNRKRVRRHLANRLSIIHQEISSICLYIEEERVNGGNDLDEVKLMHALDFDRLKEYRLHKEDEIELSALGTFKDRDWNMPTSNLSYLILKARLESVLRYEHGEIEEEIGEYFPCVLTSAEYEFPFLKKHLGEVMEKMNGNIWW